MKDFIPKGNGNSRSLKSSIPNGTTWEQALEMLRNGTFPIDIGAANEAGVLQKGNPLNKSTLLKDETAALFNGLPENPVPDEVFQILSKAALAAGSGLELPNGEKVGSMHLFSGSYVGTGEGKKVSISFETIPEFVIIVKDSIKSNEKTNVTVGFITKKNEAYQFTGLGVEDEYSHGLQLAANVSGATISWNVVGGQAIPGMNQNNKTYRFFALIM